MTTVTSEQVIMRLRHQACPRKVAGMARFGIQAQQALGVSMPILRQMAREIKRNHALALELWASGIHEARILASLVAEPDKMTRSQAEQWVGDMDSWDVCDQCCGNLFDKTSYAWNLPIEWAAQPAEFVRRAGFVMMAVLAVHDKQASDERFDPFFPLIREGARDERNFVKKAVNWALRQMGKRSVALNRQAQLEARALQAINTPAARWIAADALRELTSAVVQVRLARHRPLDI